MTPDALTGKSSSCPQAGPPADTPPPLLGSAARLGAGCPHSPPVSFSQSGAPNARGQGKRLRLRSVLFIPMRELTPP